MDKPVQPVKAVDKLGLVGNGQGHLGHTRQACLAKAAARWSWENEGSKLLINFRTNADVYENECIFYNEHKSLLHSQRKFSIAHANLLVFKIF